jgi:uncharacterized membrane protein
MGVAIHSHAALSERLIGSATGTTRIMKDWLTTATEYSILMIDAIALIVIVAGTLQAFVAAIRVQFSDSTGHQRRTIWLHYGRWLVAGLSFQLAADIIESSITTDWMSVGRLAAIAIIRTFLNYFLERDLDELREREKPSEHSAPA